MFSAMIEVSAIRANKKPSGNISKDIPTDSFSRELKRAESHGFARAERAEEHFCSARGGGIKERHPQEPDPRLDRSADASPQAVQVAEQIPLAASTPTCLIDGWGTLLVSGEARVGEGTPDGGTAAVQDLSRQQAARVAVLKQLTWKDVSNEEKLQGTSRENNAAQIESLSRDAGVQQSHVMERPRRDLIPQNAIATETVGVVREHGNVPKESMLDPGVFGRVLRKRGFDVSGPTELTNVDAVRTGQQSVNRGSHHIVYVGADSAPPAIDGGAGQAPIKINIEHKEDNNGLLRVHGGADNVPRNDSGGGSRLTGAEQSDPTEDMLSVGFGLEAAKGIFQSDSSVETSKDSTQSGSISPIPGGTEEVETESPAETDKVSAGLRSQSLRRAPAKSTTGLETLNSISDGSVSEKEREPGGELAVLASNPIRLSSHPEPEHQPPVVRKGERPEDPRAVTSPNVFQGEQVHENSWASRKAYINTSDVARHLKDTEVRVGFSTRQSGNVEIHAVVRDGRTDAVVSVENKEIRSALIADISNLRSSLEGQHVDLGQLTVVEHRFGSGSDGTADNNRGRSTANHSEEGMGRDSLRAKNEGESIATDHLTGLSVHA